MSFPPPRCWPPGCWSRSAAGGGSSCGGGRSAAASRVRIRMRRWPRRRCGSARTTPPCGCSTPACGTCPGSSPPGTRRRRRCSRPISARKTWTCGSPRPTRTRRGRGRPPTAARCGGCRSRPSPGLDAPEAGAAPGTLAPYPGLVSLGTNASGRILVDLEVAHGLIAVRGPRAVVQAALSRARRRAGDEPVVRPDAGHARSASATVWLRFLPNGSGFYAPSTRPCPSWRSARPRSGTRWPRRDSTRC